MENDNDKFQEENFLSRKDKKNSYVLPEGYFNSFSTRLLNRMECEQELAEFKILSSVNRKLKFAVPQNYFSSLTGILEYKYETSVFPELSKIAKPALKPLPADYFEAMDKKLMEKIELTSELKEFSVLSSIEKKNNFRLVPDYFENSTDEVKEKIHAANQSIPNVFQTIFEQLFATLFRPKMAFALSFILIVGCTAVWYFNRKDSSLETGACKTLACLEKNELLNENNIRDFDDENLYEMVDMEMLDKQISGVDTDKDSLKKIDNK
ncbi:MAG: hypothetical protein Q7W13_04320 [Bacteroidia bacterium]|nr:hypothetical protein [Bacteroidia bacterium]